LLTVPNVPLRFVPTVVRAVMITTAIGSPRDHPRLSIAVAPAVMTETMNVILVVCPVFLVNTRNDSLLDA
jgi:hypothetical protein